MGRIRTIKPDFFRSRSLAKVSLPARVTFQGLWCEADDHGRGIADPRLLAAALWPLDDEIDAQKVAEHIEELEATGHITLYVVDGESYYVVAKWEKHQAAAYRRGEALHPAPPGETPPSQPPHDEPCKEMRDARPVVLERKGREGKGKDGAQTPSAPTRPPDLLFEAVCAVSGIDPTHVTKDERGRVNNACKQLREVQATPDEVHQRARVWRRKFPEAHLTPQSLTKSWTTLAGTARTNAPARCGRCSQPVGEGHTPEACRQMAKVLGRIA